MYVGVASNSFDVNEAIVVKVIDSLTLVTERFETVPIGCPDVVAIFPVSWVGLLIFIEFAEKLIISC